MNIDDFVACVIRIKTMQGMMLGNCMVILVLYALSD